MSKPAPRNYLRSFTPTILAGILGSTIVVTLFWYIFDVLFPHGSYTFDISVSELIYSLRTPPLTQWMLFITMFGVDFAIFIGAVVLFLFQRIHRTRESIVFIVAVLCGVLLNVFLKQLFHRMRPDSAPLIVEKDYSYPSGHAMDSFIFYGLLAYYMIVFTKKQFFEVVIAVFSVVMIVLIGFSRVYLGVHYPTDIIGGYLAGFCIVIAAVYANLRLDQHSKRT